MKSFIELGYRKLQYSTHFQMLLKCCLGLIYIVQLIKEYCFNYFYFLLHGTKFREIIAHLKVGLGKSGGKIVVTYIFLCMCGFCNLYMW